MTEIQQNRWDQLVRRVANIVSGGSMVSDALNELFPHIDVETLLAELQLLKGTRICIGAVNHPSSAGDVNHTQVFNPVGSGIICTVTAVQFRAATLQEIRYAMSNVPLTDSTATAVVFDGRLGILQNPTCQLRSVQQVGLLGRQGAYLVEANVTRELKDSNGLFVLSPGTGVTFATSTAAVASIFNYYWRERLAEPAELNF